MTTREVIDKYFKDDRTMYFHPSDRQGDCYLRYRFDGGVELTMGSDEGEVVILFTSDAEKLEQLIKLLVY